MRCRLVFCSDVLKFCAVLLECVVALAGYGKDIFQRKVLILFHVPGCVAVVAHSTARVAVCVLTERCRTISAQRRVIVSWWTSLSV